MLLAKSPLSEPLLLAKQKAEEKLHMVRSTLIFLFLQLLVIEDLKVNGYFKEGSKK